MFLFYKFYILTFQFHPDIFHCYNHCKFGFLHSEQDNAPEAVRLEAPTEYLPEAQVSHFDLPVSG
jgi:hypothetical protein